MKRRERKLRNLWGRRHDLEVVELRSRHGAMRGTPRGYPNIRLARGRTASCLRNPMDRGRLPIPCSRKSIHLSSMALHLRSGRGLQPVDERFCPRGGRFRVLTERLARRPTLGMMATSTARIPRAPRRIEHRHKILAPLPRQLATQNHVNVQPNVVNGPNQSAQSRQRGQAQTRRFQNFHRGGGGGR